MTAMQTNETQDIKRRADGSIDTAHYMKIGRHMRSEQAHKLAKDALPKRKPFSFRLWPLSTARA
jgi:hypothetical protein